MGTSFFAAALLLHSTTILSGLTPTTIFKAYACIPRSSGEAPTGGSCQDNEQIRVEDSGGNEAAWQSPSSGDGIGSEAFGGYGFGQHVMIGATPDSNTNSGSGKSGDSNTNSNPSGDTSDNNNQQQGTGSPSDGSFGVPTIVDGKPVGGLPNGKTDGGGPSVPTELKDGFFQNGGLPNVGQGGGIHIFGTCISLPDLHIGGSGCHH